MKLWAYKSAIAVFVLFVLYQAYRFTYSHSLILGGVIIFDAILIGLIVHEYKHAKKRLETEN